MLQLDAGTEFNEPLLNRISGLVRVATLGPDLSIPVRVALDRSDEERETPVDLPRNEA